MSVKPAAFIYSTVFENYSYPPEHPFNTIRAKMTLDTVKSMGFMNSPSQVVVKPWPAKRLVLKKFHSARYLHALEEASDGKWGAEALNMGLGTSDCPVFKGMFEYAVLAVGATLTGAQLILDGKANVAFNPSGGYHHAHPEQAAGFCYINDSALACILFAEQGKKVLYLDVDVHNGDGVAAAFYERNDVMTISLHQNPKTLFPGTGFEDEIGKGAGRGFCVNIPLPIGTFDEAYMHAFNTTVMPLIGAFKPDVFVFEFGADALAGDPLANLMLTNNVYADIIKLLLGFDKPVLMTGGGGYNVPNTVRAWALGWSVLCGIEPEYDQTLGLGGVMLQTTEWAGGLRDRHLPVNSQQRDAVFPTLNDTLDRLKATLFPLHGL